MLSFILGSKKLSNKEMDTTEGKGQDSGYQCGGGKDM